MRDERELANMIVGITGAKVDAGASLHDLLVAAYAALVEQMEADIDLRNAFRRWTGEQ